MVPCSSKVEKYERLINKKIEQNKPADAVRIVSVEGRKTALLFQDMFPVREDYIDAQYVKNGHCVEISGERQKDSLAKTARKIRRMLKHGVRFTPTQPDIVRIEKIMLK